MSNSGDKEGNHSMKSVLFVCLGNICRSPMAEAVFLDLIKTRSDHKDWKVDSCATGNWHTGERPDPRCFKILKENGIRTYQHTVRQITQIDFKTYHHIFGMDENNMSDLNGMKPPGFTGILNLLGKYDSQNTTGLIRDPYYDNDDKGFKVVYELSKRALEAFLENEEFGS